MDGEQVAPGRSRRRFVASLCRDGIFAPASIELSVCLQSLHRSEQIEGIRSPFIIATVPSSLAQACSTFCVQRAHFREVEILGKSDMQAGYPNGSAICSTVQSMMLSLVMTPSRTQ